MIATTYDKWWLPRLPPSHITHHSQKSKIGRNAKTHTQGNVIRQAQQRGRGRGTQGFKEAIWALQPHPPGPFKVQWRAPVALSRIGVRPQAGTNTSNLASKWSDEVENVMMSSRLHNLDCVTWRDRTGWVGMGAIETGVATLALSYARQCQRRICKPGQRRLGEDNNPQGVLRSGELKAAHRNKSMLILRIASSPKLGSPPTSAICKALRIEDMACKPCSDTCHRSAWICRHLLMLWELSGGPHLQLYQVEFPVKDGPWFRHTTLAAFQWW